MRRAAVLCFTVALAACGSSYPAGGGRLAEGGSGGAGGTGGSGGAGGTGGGGSGGVVTTPEDLGPFDRIAGFHGDGELLALRNLAPEGIGDLWVATREESRLLAVDAILPSVDVQPDRLHVFFATGARSEYEAVHRWHYASTTLHLWNGGEAAYPVADGVRPFDHELCGPAGRLWVWTDVKDAYPYANCGRLAWIDLSSGAAAPRHVEEVCHTEPFRELARFGDGCGSLIVPSVDRLIRRDLAAGAVHALTQPGDNAGRYRFSVDGAKVAYHARPAAGTGLTLHVRALQGEELARIEGAEPLRFSPDGQAIAYRYVENGTSRLGLARFDQREPLQLTRDVWDVGDRPRSVRFSPDGSLLVAFATPRRASTRVLEGVRLDGAVIQIGIGVSELAWWGEPRLPDLESVVFSADGKRVVFFGLPDDGAEDVRELRVADLEILGLSYMGTQDPITVLGTAKVVETDTPWDRDRVLAVASPDGTRIAWVTPEGALRRATVDGGTALVSRGPVTDLAITDRELAWIEGGRLLLLKLP